METGEISGATERRDWSELDLFADLDQVEIEALRRALEPVDFKAGSAIMREDETGHDMFLLDRGSVKIEAHGSDATSRFSTILHAPTAFGEMALITSEPRTASVWAHTDVKCLRLNRGAFDGLLEEHVSVARILTRLVGDRLQEIGGIRKVGKYQIIGVLGKGNVAHVFEALHPELGQSVALKMLSHALVFDPQFGVQFDREAQIVAALDHPHIVRVFDFERAYGTRFTVMERLEGQQLEDSIYRGKRLAWAEIRKVIFEVGDALHYSHQRGLIHRDVKPSNIFITRKQQTKLLDFGISVHQDHSECKNKARLGSPCYMPPEQILGEQLDGRADLYALGITAFEMVVGEVPFNESDIRSLLRRQVREPTPDVKRLVPNCPDDIAEFIRRATEKRREDRYTDCRVAVAALAGRNVSEPLVRAHRVKVSIDYGTAAEHEVERLVDELTAVLGRNPSVSLKITRN